MSAEEATRLHYCGAGYSDNVHPVTLIWSKERHFSVEKGGLPSAIIQMGTGLSEERVPKDNLGALAGVGGDKVHLCCVISHAHREVA